jgi:hypothetical protein
MLPDSKPASSIMGFVSTGCAGWGRFVVKCRKCRLSKKLKLLMQYSKRRQAGNRQSMAGKMQAIRAMHR